MNKHNRYQITVNSKHENKRVRFLFFFFLVVQSRRVFFLFLSYSFFQEQEKELMGL